MFGSDCHDVYVVADCYFGRTVAVQGERPVGCPPGPARGSLTFSCSHMINIPLGLPLRIIRKPAKPLAAAALSGEGGSFPLIGYINIPLFP